MSEAKSFEQVRYMLFQRVEFLLFHHWECLRFRLIYILCVFFFMVSQTLLNLFSFLSGPAGSGFDFCSVVKHFKRNILRKCVKILQSHIFWKVNLKKKKRLNNVAFYLKVYQNNETLRKYSHYWCSTKVNTNLFTCTWSTKCKSWRWKSKYYIKKL